MIISFNFQAPSSISRISLYGTNISQGTNGVISLKYPPCSSKHNTPCMIIRKLIITRFLSFNIVVQYIQILWTFDYFPVALTTLRSVLPLPLSELFIAGCCRNYPSTYFHQVYDDNRWWISWYQTSSSAFPLFIIYNM